MRTQADGTVDWAADMDIVAVEEPLNIRVHYQRNGVAVTENFALAMRTPGHDVELVTGFLLSEGVIERLEDLLDIRSIGVEGSGSNDVIAELSPALDYRGWQVRRSTITNSACGLCGSAREELLPETLSVHEQTFALKATSILQLPDLLGRNQTAFQKTGGLHAAALVDFDEGQEPRLRGVFEDIGRHNALDKLIGWATREGFGDMRGKAIFVSSRGSFELVQKTLSAGVAVLACVGSPSSMAVEMARKAGLTLIGFLREGRFNVYAGEWRIHSK